ncbi:DinB family protein [Dermatophilaceae bacterium Soc4.6]
MTDATSHPQPDLRPDTGDERRQLLGFLQGQRDILLRKCEGLDAIALGATHPPSTLTLGGLLHHAALNEDWWFSVRMTGAQPPPPWDRADWDADPDWEFTRARDLTADALVEQYRLSCARSDVVLAGVGLETLAAVAHGDGLYGNVRWIVLHMIEETARHAGHADLLREAIDGRTGE